jgi:hypothetical protein
MPRVICSRPEFKWELQKSGHNWWSPQGSVWTSEHHTVCYWSVIFSAKGLREMKKHKWGKSALTSIVISLFTFNVLKSRGFWWGTQHGCKSTLKIIKIFSCEMDYLEHLAKAGRVILKLILMQYDWEVWTGFIWPGPEQVASSCEHGNEPLSSIDAENILTSWGPLASQGLCSVK